MSYPTANYPAYRTPPSRAARGPVGCVGIGLPCWSLWSRSVAAVAGAAIMHHYDGNDR